jgi:osmotically-inducible protein OsmY
MASQYAAQTKLVRAQITRRNVDSSGLNVQVSGSTVYLTGVLRVLRTHANVNLQDEMNQISQILKQQAGIREVVWDVSLRS